MNLIFTAFATLEGYREGSNANLGSEVFYRCIVVSLVSAKQKNQNCDAALVTNTAVPEPYAAQLSQAGIRVIACPFDNYRFEADLDWSLAYYKLCAMQYLLETDSQVDDGMTDMILYLHFNNETGQVKMLQIPRNIFVTTDASFSGNYQINAIAKTQGSNGSNNISALADEIHNIFGLHVDGYLSVRLEALTQIIDTFGGIQVYVPQDMDYGGSHLSQGYQTMDGAAAEFFLRTRHIYADSDLGRLRMQRYFYAALFARMRSMTVWDIAKLLPVITSQMETDLSATELVSVAVSMLKISSSNIMFCQAPVYMGQAISYNGNSTVVVARQETADLLNEYFRENTGPVDASQLNIAGDDGLFDLSGLTASDPSVQFMGTLNEEISNAQQTNNIDGSDTTDVYDTATPAPDDSTDGDSTDGDSTPSE